MRSAPKVIGRVAVGMSGGVDSAAAAWLLRERGFDVVGVTLELCAPGAASSRSCGAGESVRRARRLSTRLGIAHHVIDVEREFARLVVDRFVSAYRVGRTPNPCIACNELVKFPALERAASRLECDAIATGHYARIVSGERGMPYIAAAADAAKDQSYFLYRLSVNTLRRTIFPLGELSKEMVKNLAARFAPAASSSRESQDICFLPDGDLRRFLVERIGERPGDVVDGTGRALGRHGGVHTVTIGQRKGLGIAGGEPLYVAGIDAANRCIMLAPKERVYFDGARCRSLRLRAGALDGPLAAKVRYRRPFAAVRDARLEGGRLDVRFVEPQWAVTPGQSLVLYRGAVVVGGGIIEEGIAAP